MLLQCYIGNDGVAHKVIKGYIGVNGVARKIYDPELAFYGLSSYKTDNLNYSRSGLATASIGDYALFGGGGTSRVESYNSSLVHSNATSFNSTKQNLAATTIGNYALFGDGG